MNIIDMYMQNLTKDKVKEVGLKNDIILNNNEVNFIYLYLKDNYQSLLRNKDNFSLEQYKTKFSEENFVKINNLIAKYINYF